MARAERSQTPLLQIVHVSDLHLLDRDYVNSSDTVVIRRLLRRADRIGPPVAQALGLNSKVFRNMLEALWAVSESGRYGHDESAIELLEEWLAERVLHDDDWQDVPIWLIDTGDQTTNGDRSSFKYSYKVLDRLSRALGGASVTRIHGNHDAWPGRPPYTSLSKRLQHHREWLRTTHYPETYPNNQCVTINTGGVGIDVFALNSIVHDWLRSCLARGEIAEDLFWKNGALWPTLDEQIRTLQALAEQRPQASEGKRLRIILSHHPVAIDHPFKLDHHFSRFIGLDNASDVATKLAQRFESLGGSPLAHLILAGHTHRLHPEIGELSGGTFGNANRTANSPLQLVIGTGVKRPAYSRLLNGDPIPRNDGTEFNTRYPQQIQVLRITQGSDNSPGSTATLGIERVVAGREFGARGEWLPCQNDPERFSVRL